MLEVVTGGSGSGKSEYAESEAIKKSCRRVYLATMQPFGKEAQERIARHKELRRGKGFETVEAYLAKDCMSVPHSSLVLLECMSNLIANEMFSAGGDCTGRVKRCIEHLAHISSELIVVTNEIFSDGVRYDAETVKYIRAMADINRYLFAVADTVTEVVYSIPVTIKSKNHCINSGGVLV